MELIEAVKKHGILSFFLLSVVFSHYLTAQTLSQGRLLAADLEKLEQESAVPAGRREALRSMAFLHQLSGNYEKALEAWLAAAEGRDSLPDYGALLEASRLLISMGEYERADQELRKVSADSGEIILKARLLWAELIAFSRRDARLLTQMASDPVYLPQRSEIYYILWKTSGTDSWKEKLLAEFPQSPEARISGAAAENDAGRINAAATPQWLLAEPSAALASVMPNEPEEPQAAGRSAQATQAPAAPAAPPHAQTSARPEGSDVFLQTGLYRVESNARNEAERLERAGFKAALVSRQLNGSNLWAVLVDGGGDSNACLRQLKNAGWTDAFPVRANL